MIRRIPIIVLSFGMMLLFSSDAPAEESPFELVKSWLDGNNLVYVTTEKNEIALGFKGDNIPRVDIIIGFSDEFIHLSVPVGKIPEDAGKDYYSGLINITGPIPMIKPFIDKEYFCYIVIDFPLTGLSEDEVISDIALLVEFADRHSKELYPWEEEN